MSVLIVKRDLILCDCAIQFEGGKIDLEGVFNGVKPFSPYPFKLNVDIVAQVCNGKGKFPFFLDVRQTSTRELVRTTHTREISLSSPKSIVTVVFRVEGLILPNPGMYSVEHFCNNVSMGDANFWANPVLTKEH